MSVVTNLMRRIIVFFHTGHPNDIQSLEYQRRTFKEFGYTIEDYSVIDPELNHKVKALIKDRFTEISFFLSSNYYGARISNVDGQLLHTTTGIPFVIMQHDHPLHYVTSQSTNLSGAITFAIGYESIDFIKQYYPNTTTLVARSGARPTIIETIPAYETFLRKRNAILCPMNLAVNGRGVDGTWQLIKDLPEARRTAATQLADLAMNDFITPLHKLARSLPGTRADHEPAALRDMLLVLNFIKVWRRNFIVRSLIDLPIIVSSEYIPGDLEFKYPDKFLLLSRSQTMPLYNEYRFVLNCNPVMTHVLHERVLEAIYANSVALTEPNTSIIEYLEDEYDCIMFDYSRDDVRAKVGKYIDEPDRAYRLTERAYRTRQASRDFGLIDSYAKLLHVVEACWQDRDAPTAPAVLSDAIGTSPT